MNTNRCLTLSFILGFSFVFAAPGQVEPTKASRDKPSPTTLTPKQAKQLEEVTREYKKFSNERHFVESVRNGDVDKVKKYLAEGGSPNVKEVTGMPVVVIAAIYRRPEVLRLLLEAKVNPNPELPPTKNLQPLYFAAENGDLESVSLLLKAGAKVDSRMKTDEPKMKQANGNTPLIASANPSGKADIVHVLVKAGADVNAKNDLGGTAILKASAAAPVEVVQALLEEKADVKTTMGPQGDLSVIMSAIMGAHHKISGRADVVKALIDAGADVNAKTSLGLTPLKMAKGVGETEITKMLEDAGATE